MKLISGKARGDGGTAVREGERGEERGDEINTTYTPPPRDCTAQIRDKYKSTNTNTKRNVNTNTNKNRYKYKRRNGCARGREGEAKSTPLMGDSPLLLLPQTALCICTQIRNKYKYNHR